MRSLKWSVLKFTKTKHPLHIIVMYYGCRPIYIFIEFLDGMLSYKFLGPHCDSDAEALRHVRVRKVIHLKNDTSAASKLMSIGLLSF